MRVYSVPSRQTGTDLTSFIACHFRTGRARRLGTFDIAVGGVEQIRQAGRYVGYDVHTSSRNTHEGRVRVKNITTGTTRRASTARTPFAVSDLDVTTSGSIVWIRPIGRRPSEQDFLYEVRKLDADGEQLLDVGADINQTSLAVSGSRAYWTRGGAPRSTVLAE